MPYNDASYEGAYYNVYCYDGACYDYGVLNVFCSFFYGVWFFAYWICRKSSRKKTFSLRYSLYITTINYSKAEILRLELSEKGSIADCITGTIDGSGT